MKKFLMANALMLACGAASAHTHWTVPECVQYSKFIETSAQGKAMGYPIEHVLNAGLQVLQKYKNIFIKDEVDMNILIESLKVVYSHDDTPQNFKEKSYEACINMMVGTLEEPNPKKKFT